MKKFKLSTEVGQSVTKIEINIRADADKNDSTSLYAEGLHIDKLKIVHQTERKIALSDKWITLLDRQGLNESKSDHWHLLEDMHVSIKTNETYFPNGIFGTVYTLGKETTAIRRLTKEMQLQVNKKYGFLANIDIESVVLKFSSQTELKEE